MNDPRLRRALTWAPVLGLVVWLFVSPGLLSSVSAKTVAGNLDVSPGEFYGGQAVTFEGDLGSAGRRQIWLEFHMNRPGDTWNRIPGSERYTDDAGNFSFSFPARAMLDISVRVSSSRTATPAVLFQAREQEVALSVHALGGLPLDLGNVLQYLRYFVLNGVPFVVRVDTSPDGEPILAGRAVTLQKRAADGSWVNVATGTIDDRGLADFQQVIRDSGSVVYRARLEAWTAGGSKIGWFPSFPTEVRALL